MRMFSEGAAVVHDRLSSQFQRDLIALIPHLGRFSRSLCGRGAIAEDMAQEALAKAWRSRASFESGTNLKAWLFTILRNEFCSQATARLARAHWGFGKRRKHRRAGVRAGMGDGPLRCHAGS